MDRIVGDHGYVPSPQRQLRLKFPEPRPLSLQDGALLAQSEHAAFQLAAKAKQIDQQQSGTSRVSWPFLDCPFGETDLIIASTQQQPSSMHGNNNNNNNSTGITVRLFKVMDWDVVWQEGDVHAELAELEAAAHALHGYLQDLECFSKNGLILSYLLCPRLHEAPEDCDVRMVCGARDCDEVLRELDVRSLRRSTQSSSSSDDVVVWGDAMWAKLRKGLDALPAYDVLYLRSSASSSSSDGGAAPPPAIWFGNFVEFEALPILTRQAEANRQQHHPSPTIEFEHARQGLGAVPLALVSGVLGWEPTTRVRINNRLNSSMDIAPATKLVFRLAGTGGGAVVVRCEVNDVQRIQLARQVRRII